MTSESTCAEPSAEDFERVLARFFEEDADDVAFENADLVITALREAAERRKPGTVTCSQCGTSHDKPWEFAPATDRDGAIDVVARQLAVDAVARQVAIANGYDPDLRARPGITDEPVWAHFKLHASRIIDAYEAHRRAREPVKVKPLEFPTNCPRGWRVHSRPSALIRYTIVHYGGDVGDPIYRWGSEGLGWSEPHHTYEAAIGCAQADYETRIRSALVDGGGNGLG